MSWRITPNIAAELVSHEGLVREAYRDAVGVWTWSIGITTSSGHDVYPRYKDNVQSIKRCLEVYEWVLRTNYLPAVKAAFSGRMLSETQLGGALSFHYNTGGISRAAWVKKWLKGDISGAKRAIMNWRRPPEILPRRRKEQALFFDGQWSHDFHATVYSVKKPEYTPDWATARKVDISAELDELFG